MLIKNKNRIDNKKKKKKTAEISIKDQCATFSEKQEVITRGFLSVWPYLNKPIKIDEKISRATKTLERADQCSYGRLSKLC